MLEVDVSFPGTVQGTQCSNLSFRVAGPTMELPVKDRDWVDKEEVLARIDPRDYKIALNEAKADPRTLFSIGAIKINRLCLQFYELG